MKTTATAEYYPVVVEQEANGTWSAYVAGLPGVYAAADSAAQAKKAIRTALAAHLEAAQTRQAAVTVKSKMHLLMLRYKKTKDWSTQGLARYLGERRARQKPRRLERERAQRRQAAPSYVKSMMANPT